MGKIKASLGRRDTKAPFEAYYRRAEQVIEQAALRAVTRGGERAVAELRRAGAAAGLGRLFQGVKDSPDDRVHRRAGGFSVSSGLYIRGSERTRGAIEAYTEGADIAPVRGKWLWIATDEIPRVTNHQRMTPALYRANGFEQSIGPLVPMRSVNGYPLLVVRQVGVSEAGLRGKAKRLNRNGRPAKGQRLKELVVAFVGIPRTSRAARIGARALLNSIARQDLPELFNEEMRRGARG